MQNLAQEHWNKQKINEHEKSGKQSSKLKISSMFQYLMPNCCCLNRVHQLPSTSSYRSTTIWIKCICDILVLPSVSAPVSRWWCWSSREPYLLRRSKSTLHVETAYSIQSLRLLVCRWKNCAQSVHTNNFQSWKSILLIYSIFFFHLTG